MLLQEALYSESDLNITSAMLYFWISMAILNKGSDHSKEKANNVDTPDAHISSEESAAALKVASPDLDIFINSNDTLKKIVASASADEERSIALQYCQYHYDLKKCEEKIRICKLKLNFLKPEDGKYAELNADLSRAEYEINDIKNAISSLCDNEYFANILKKLQEL